MTARWRSLGLLASACAVVACTQIKPLSVAGSTPTPTASPTGDPSVAGFGSSDPGSTSEAKPPTSVPLVLPTPGPLGTLAPFPQASFTPGMITPLDPNATAPAQPATGAASPSPGTTVTPSPTASGTTTASPSPGSSPTPVPSAFPSVAHIGPIFTGGQAIDASNHLWLGDTAAKAIKLYTQDGAIQGTFPLPQPPAAICFDSLGNLWVQLADFVTMVKLDRGGANLGTFHLSLGGTADEAAIPGLAALPDGTMWVLNGGGMNTLVHMSAAGKEINTVEPPGRVAAMASDAGGNIWVAIDDANVELAKYGPDGTQLNTVTDLAGTESLKALAVDTQGTVWLAGRSTPTGQPTQGQVVGFAGTGTRLATLATGADRAPSYISFDRQGDLVLADGVSGSIHDHTGFMRLSRSGQVLSELRYDFPVAVVADTGDDFFWGTNGATEAFRFKF